MRTEFGVEELAGGKWGKRRREKGVEKRGIKKNRGRGEGRGNKPAPVGAAPRRGPAERARKVRATSPAQRPGAVVSHLASSATLEKRAAEKSQI